jgi:hypothetical protein
MAPLDPPEWCPTVERWGEGFARYLASGDGRVPRDLVEPAQRIYADLCRTQRVPALLHGDLHHYNVLSDRARGWCAVDPRGVVGELEYEIGAALRNPIDRPDIFAKLDVVERRLDQFGLALGIDVGRARMVLRTSGARGDLEQRGRQGRCNERRAARARACIARFELSQGRFPRLSRNRGGNMTGDVRLLAGG